MDKAHTTPRYRAPTAMAPVFPSLIVWTLTLVAFSWWRTSPPSRRTAVGGHRCSTPRVSRFWCWQRGRCWQDGAHDMTA